MRHSARAPTWTAFAAFGLERKLVIDLVPGLNSAITNVGRKVHPDRFAGESAVVRAASLKSTANLTRAYRALRDPVARGLYWLELHGRKLSEAISQCLLSWRRRYLRFRSSSPSCAKRADAANPRIADGCGRAAGEGSNRYRKALDELRRQFCRRGTVGWKAKRKRCLRRLNRYWRGLPICGRCYAILAMLLK